jgi:hypothetical protein
MSHHGHHKSQSTNVESKPVSSPANDQGRQEPTDRVRLRAYEISQGRNGGPGDAMADWIQAEQEVAAQPNPKR